MQRFLGILYLFLGAGLLYLHVYQSFNYRVLDLHTKALEKYYEEALDKKNSLQGALAVLKTYSRIEAWTADQLNYEETSQRSYHVILSPSPVVAP